MTELSNAVYRKVGATFADGVAAHIDKNSLFPQELTDSVQNCFASMTENGILFEIIYLWDQESYTLTVRKTVSSCAEYGAAITFDAAAVKAAGAAAGWTYIPNL
jgi:hypothetical protein